MTHIPPSHAKGGAGGNAGAFLFGPGRAAAIQRHVGQKAGSGPYRVPDLPRIGWIVDRFTTP